MAIVYVFGAGLSNAVNPNAPLTNGLLKGVLQLLVDATERSSERNAAAEQLVRLADYLNVFYLGRPPSAPFSNNDIRDLPTIEDILGQLDLSIQEKRPLSSIFTVDYLQVLRNDLIYSISVVLQNLLAIDEQSSYGSRHLALARLVKKLTPKDSIITLNYDIIVDNALQRRSGVDSRVNYGFTPRYKVPYDGDPTLYPPPYPHSETPEPSLYKLHGSLNWLYCPLCQEIDVTTGWKGTVQGVYGSQGRLQCKDCHTQYEALIVAPTLLKSYDNVLLNSLWRQAENKLATADKIIFVGYSLPDADLHLKCMLKRAIFRNPRSHTSRPNGASSWITLIGRGPDERDATASDTVASQPNNSAAAPQNGTREPDCGPTTIERYRRLFGSWVDYHEPGFRDFVDERYPEANRETQVTQ